MLNKALVWFPLLLVGAVFAHEGSPVSLFQHLSNRSYEVKADGTDSYVLEVAGLKHFYSDIAKSSKPVVIKFFSSKSPILTVTAPIFQNIAEEFKGSLRFAALDIMSNYDMVKKIVAFFVQTAIQLKASGRDSEFFKRVSELIQRFAALEQSSTATPFVLFFRDGYLIFPETFDFLNRSKLLNAFRGQLMNKELPSDGIRLFDSPQPSNKGWWRRLKDKACGFWVKKK